MRRTAASLALVASWAAFASGFVGAPLGAWLLALSGAVLPAAILGLYRDRIPAAAPVLLGGGLAAALAALLLIDQFAPDLTLFSLPVATALLLPVVLIPYFYLGIAAARQRGTSAATAPKPSATP